MKVEKKQHHSDKGGANSPDVPEIAARAYRYYLKALTAKEIGKLIDVSPRTVQRWFSLYQFEKLAEMPDCETIPQKAVRMAAAGLSYSQIAKKLRRCKATIYNYVKAAKNESSMQAG